MERKTEVALKYPVGTWLYGFDVLTAKDGNEFIQKAVPWDHPYRVTRWNIGFNGADRPLIVMYELMDTDDTWNPSSTKEVYEEYLFETKEACQSFCEKGNRERSWGSWRGSYE